MSPSTKPLRIGLLVEDGSQAWNLFEWVDWARSRPELTISHLLIVCPGAKTEGSRESSRRSRGFIGELVARLFDLLARIETPMVSDRIAGFHSAARRDARTLELPIVELTMLSPDPTPDYGTDVEFTPESLDLIGRLDLDLVVALERNRASRCIAPLTRLGVLALEHGTGVALAEAIGFLEVYNRKSVTEFRVVHYYKDERTLLLAGGVRNRPAYLLNQTALLRLSLFHLKRLIGEVCTSGAIAPGMGGKLVNDAPCVPIGLGHLVIYVSRIVSRVADTLLSRLLSRRRSGWSVYFAPVSWPHLNPDRSTVIENPPNAFLADPFVIDEGGKTYCFVEELDFQTGRGCISAYVLGTSGATRIGKVIVEPFHMSFPYLFRYGSKLFMVPETAVNGDIRIYECLRVPERWTLRKSISLGMPTADTMLFEHEGRWWMFTNPDAAGIGDHCSELRIYYADHPFSDEWIPHDGNPISLDPLFARNGGILFDSGTIYRVAQRQGFDRYGLDFSLRRIDVLTPDRYVEVAEEECLKSFERPSGVHHLHANHDFCVFDHDRVDPRASAAGKVDATRAPQVLIARSRA